MWSITTERPGSLETSGRNNTPITSHENWQEALANSLASVDELVLEGLLKPHEASQLRNLGTAYQVRLTRYYASLMDNSDQGRGTCPIRLQALPSLGEADPTLPSWAREWSLKAYGREVPWTPDAIGDLTRLAAPRLTHRYGNRAILHVSSMCALYCRFCFRKSHLNSKDRLLYDGSFDAALEYLCAHPEIRELLLTGGDPLSLTDSALERLFDRLEGITHVKHLRIHSRMASTLPHRLTDGLIETLARQRRFKIALVSHFNHPKEFTSFARARLDGVASKGVALYNQSVLLRGVNDDGPILEELFQSLYESGVTPFYLHHPDWTPGTFHFRCSIARGQELMSGLSGRLSGPALPHYVLDLPNGLGKVPLMADKIKLIDTRSEPRLEGALYELTPPKTLQKQASTVLYTDFSRP
ncbi:MAG: KamA family radical SAM protein [Bdellovibrionota bacterium]